MILHTISYEPVVQQKGAYGLTRFFLEKPVDPARPRNPTQDELPGIVYPCAQTSDLPAILRALHPLLMASLGRAANDGRYVVHHPFIPSTDPDNLAFSVTLLRRSLPALYTPIAQLPVPLARDFHRDTRIWLNKGELRSNEQPSTMKVVLFPIMPTDFAVDLLPLVQRSLVATNMEPYIGNNRRIINVMPADVISYSPDMNGDLQKAIHYSLELGQAKAASTQLTT
jgi:hypothetical protein